MPWFRASRHITHGEHVCPVGFVIELGANESKSDGFVPCDAPAGAVKVEADKVEADEPKPYESKKHKGEARSDK